MWTISMLKENAKKALKGFYWTAVLVTLIVSILGGGSGGGGSYPSNSSRSIEEMFDTNTGSGYDYDYDYDYDFDDFDFDNYDFDDFDYDYYDDFYDDYDFDDDNEFIRFMAGLLIAVGVILFIAFVITIAFRTFVSNPVKVGQNRFYLDARMGDVGVGKIFSNFKNGAYLHTVGTMFIMNLKIFLWSLLFIIPGIVKSYEYFLVPYIIADNPQIDRRRAFEISKKTMNGEKANCFLLGLSFIGWTILGSMLVIGTLFVMPYINATMTEFYCCMKQKAIATGIATSDEFGDYNGFFGQTGSYGGTGGYDASTGYNPTSGYNPATGYNPASNNQNSGMTQYNPISEMPQVNAPNSTMDEIRTDIDDKRFGSSYMDDIGMGIGDNEKDDYTGPEIK